MELRKKIIILLCPFCVLSSPLTFSHAPKLQLLCLQACFVLIWTSMHRAKHSLYLTKIADNCLYSANPSNSVCKHTSLISRAIALLLLQPTRQYTRCILITVSCLQSAMGISFPFLPSPISGFLYLNHHKYGIGTSLCSYINANLILFYRLGSVLHHKGQCLLSEISVQTYTISQNLTLIYHLCRRSHISTYPLSSSR